MKQKMENSQLREIVYKVFAEDSYVQAINLSSVDGFSIYSFKVIGYKIEKDKLSAVSSSLLSLSNAATKQLINSQLINTIIESEDGNMVIVKTKYQGKQAVLTVITEAKLNIGKSRYFAIKLAKSIKEQMGELTPN